MLVASLAIELRLGWRLIVSMVEATAFSAGMTLVFFGEQIPLEYTPKAILIVLAVVVSTWAIGRRAHEVRAQQAVRARTDTS